MSAWVWIAVAAVGGAGALARFALDAAISAAGRNFPLGTFAVNITGSALLGLLTGLAPGGDLELILGTGLLGAYTTFSTWVFETQRLAEDGQTLMAALNLAVSLGVGLAAIAVGRTL